MNTKPKCAMTVAKVDTIPAPRLTNVGGIRIDPTLSREERKADVLRQIQNRPSAVRDILLTVL